MKAKIIVSLALVAVAAVTVSAIAAISELTLIKPAPEVRFTPLSGEAFSTSELRGKVVLVNFWATYCAACLEEMPKLIETHKKFAPRGYETVAVAVRHDNPSKVARFAEKNGLPFRVALDSSGELAKEFGNVRITPMGFLIDKQGRVLKRFVGEPNWSEFHELVERALAAS
jgi:peroxiredoxin